MILDYKTIRIVENITPFPHLSIPFNKRAVLRDFETWDAVGKAHKAQGVRYVMVDS
jgi:hypothetical protein